MPAVLEDDELRTGDRFSGMLAVGEVDQRIVPSVDDEGRRLDRKSTRLNSSHYS